MGAIMDSGSMTRRSLLRTAFLAASSIAGAGLLAACGQAPAPTATPAPAKPAEPAPTPTQPAQKPTAAPAVQPTATPVPAAQPSATPVAKPTAAAAPIKLKFHGRNVAFDDIYVDLVKEYMAKHPNVTIEYERTASGEYLQKQLIMAAAGTFGDAVGPNWPYGVFYKFAYNGIYIDHLPYIKAAKFDLDALLPQAVEVVTIGGKVYGLPHSAHPGTVGMFINKTMFEKAGVPVPKMEWTQEAHPGLKDWTYDDALKAALALTKREGGRTTQFGIYIAGGTGQLYTLLMSFGGDYINPEGTKTTLDTPEALAAIQWLADLYNKHKVSPRPADLPTGGPDLFASGKLAMASTQVYMLKQAHEAYKDLDWMVIPMPRGKAGVDAHIGVDVWGVLSTSKHPDIAFDVISTFASYETGLRQAQWGGVPGSQKAVWDNADLLKDPNFAVFARMIKTISGLRTAANLRTDEWETEWRRLFTPLWVGEETDVQKLVKEATPRLDAILAKPRAGLTG